MDKNKKFNNQLLYNFIMNDLNLKNNMIGGDNDINQEHLKKLRERNRLRQQQKKQTTEQLTEQLTEQSTEQSREESKRESTEQPTEESKGELTGESTEQPTGKLDENKLDNDISNKTAILIEQLKRLKKENEELKQIQDEQEQKKKRDLIIQIRKDIIKRDEELKRLKEEKKQRDELLKNKLAQETEQKRLDKEQEEQRRTIQNVQGQVDYNKKLESILERMAEENEETKKILEETRRDFGKEIIELSKKTEEQIKRRTENLQKQKEEVENKINNNYDVRIKTIEGTLNSKTQEVIDTLKRTIEQQELSYKTQLEELERDNKQTEIELLKAQKKQQELMLKQTQETQIREIITKGKQEIYNLKKEKLKQIEKEINQLLTEHNNSIKLLQDELKNQKSVLENKKKQQQLSLEKLKKIKEEQLLKLKKEELRNNLINEINNNKDRYTNEQQKQELIQRELSIRENEISSKAKINADEIMVNLQNRLLQETTERNRKEQEEQILINKKLEEQKRINDELSQKFIEKLQQETNNNNIQEQISQEEIIKMTNLISNTFNEIIKQAKQRGEIAVMEREKKELENKQRQEELKKIEYLESIQKRKEEIELDYQNKLNQIITIQKKTDIKLTFDDKNILNKIANIMTALEPKIINTKKKNKDQENEQIQLLKKQQEINKNIIEFIKNRISIDYNKYNILKDNIALQTLLYNEDSMNEITINTDVFNTLIKENKILKDEITPEAVFIILNTTLSINTKDLNKSSTADKLKTGLAFLNYLFERYKNNNINMEIKDNQIKDFFYSPTTSNDVIKDKVIDLITNYQKSIIELSNEIKKIWYSIFYFLDKEKQPDQDSPIFEFYKPKPSKVVMKKDSLRNCFIIRNKIKKIIDSFNYQTDNIAEEYIDKMYLKFDELQKQFSNSNYNPKGDGEDKTKPLTYQENKAIYLEENDNMDESSSMSSDSNIDTRLSSLLDNLSIDDFDDEDRTIRFDNNSEMSDEDELERLLSELRGGAKEKKHSYIRFLQNEWKGIIFTDNPITAENNNENFLVKKEFYDKLTDLVSNEKVFTNQIEIFNFQFLVNTIMKKQIDLYITSNELQADSIIFLYKGGTTMRILFNKYKTQVFNKWYSPFVDEFIKYFDPYFKRSDSDYEIKINKDIYTDKKQFTRIVYDLSKIVTKTLHYITRQIKENSDMFQCLVPLFKISSSDLSKKIDIVNEILKESKINSLNKLRKDIAKQRNMPELQIKQDEVILTDREHFLSSVEKFIGLTIGELNIFKENETIPDNFDYIIKNEDTLLFTQGTVLAEKSDEMVEKEVLFKATKKISASKNNYYLTFIDFDRGDGVKDKYPKLIYTSPNEEHDGIYTYLNETTRFKKNTQVNEFLLHRAKINSVFYYKTMDNKYGYIDFPSELIDISISLYDENETDAPKFEFNNHIKKYKYSNSGDTLVFWSFSIPGFINDINTALFYENEFPWEDVKYDKKIRRLLFFILIEFINTENNRYDNPEEAFNYLQQFLNLLLEGSNDDKKNSKTYLDNYIQLAEEFFPEATILFKHLYMLETDDMAYINKPIKKPKKKSIEEEYDKPLKDIQKFNNFKKIIKEVFAKFKFFRKKINSNLTPEPVPYLNKYTKN